MTRSRIEEKGDVMPGTLEMLIPKTLTRGVMPGYGIAQHIRLLSEEVLRVKEGSLYPALQRLQLQGWVASEWVKLRGRGQTWQKLGETWAKSWGSSP